MRAFVAAIVVLAFAGFATTEDKKDEKIDVKKLIGKWERVEPPADKAFKIVLEFADKGKVTMTMTIDKDSEKSDGTYKLDGNKLELMSTDVGKEKKETLTIVKFTDDVLVTKDSRGKEDTFNRIKPKK
ncbi:MAG: TIGR03066 family protein [Planctomycetes bacterium]|nr:TIGR03066 family protein [Planctomycetota bacterium]